MAAKDAPKIHLHPCKTSALKRRGLLGQCLWRVLLLSRILKQLLPMSGFGLQGRLLEKIWGRLGIKDIEAIGVCITCSSCEADLYFGEFSLFQNSKLVISMLTHFHIFTTIALPWSDPRSDQGPDAPFSSLPASHCAWQMEHHGKRPMRAPCPGKYCRELLHMDERTLWGLWAAFRQQRLQDFVIRARRSFAADEHIRRRFNGARTPDGKMWGFWEKRHFYPGFIVLLISQLKPSPRWAMRKADKEAENRSCFPALSRQRLHLPLPLLLCSLEVLGNRWAQTLLKQQQLCTARLFYV